jgi:2-oxoglutarate dehydrogenase E2 component (dihydrolipoamide succinyltransferase)
MGESVVEGTVERWFKAAGDSVTKLEPLLSIRTDKIDTEVPAPATGVLLAIHVAEGATVEAGAVLALIGAPGELAVPVSPELPAQPPTPLQRSRAAPPAAPSPTVSPNTDERPRGRIYISPVVKRIVREQGVDLTEIEGTGAGGRITKRDVLAHVATRATGHTKRDRSEILHPLTPMRRAIAQHMVQSVQTSPHVATIFEVDMTAVVRHREAHKGALADRGVRLGFIPYFVAAVAAALQAHPRVNSRFTDGGILEAGQIHIGVAVALPDGLVVPVIRNANNLPLAALAAAVEDFAARARSGALLPDELQGGTFTITNHGVGGSLIGTPIINQPQAAILGIGAIVKRPIALVQNRSLLPSADDAVAIRPMCYLTLSFDHRILDGAAADAFMRAVVGMVEEWQDDG